jgi:hypothetical protein
MWFINKYIKNIIFYGYPIKYNNVNYNNVKNNNVKNNNVKNNNVKNNNVKNNDVKNNDVKNNVINKIDIKIHDIYGIYLTKYYIKINMKDGRKYAILSYNDIFNKNIIYKKLMNKLLIYGIFSIF